MGTSPLSGAACAGGQVAARSLCVQTVGGGLERPGGPGQWWECIRGALSWRSVVQIDSLYPLSTAWAFLQVVFEYYKRTFCRLLSFAQWRIDTYGLATRGTPTRPQSMAMINFGIWRDSNSVFWGGGCVVIAVLFFDSIFYTVRKMRYQQIV